MTTNTLTYSPAPRASLGGALFRVLGFLRETSPRLRCVAEAEQLMSLTDAELAARGLTRDRVIQHVFRQHFYL